MNKKRLIFFFVILTSMLMVFLFMFNCFSSAFAKRSSSSVHDLTKLTVKKVVGSIFQFGSQPLSVKRYKGARLISLPKPDFTGELLEKTIQKRRSVRNYTDGKITLSEFSQLLFAAQGMTGYEQDYAFRTAPSAGALYPLEVYAVAMRVEGVEPGIYHYVIGSHELELVKSGNFKRRLIEAALGQEMVGEAAVTFIISAVFDRITFKYGERGYRYVYIEAGHVSQNLFLQSTSLGLGSVCVGAFYDDKMNALINVDGTDEAVIYLHSVGNI